MQILTFHVIFITVFFFFSNSILSILMALTEGPVAKVKMSNCSISSTVSCLSFISYSIYFLTSSWVDISTKLSTIILMCFFFFLEIFPGAKHIIISLYLSLIDCLYASDNIKHRKYGKNVFFPGFFHSKGQNNFNVQKYNC